MSDKEAEGAVYITLELMKSGAARTFLVRQLRPGLHAALGGTVFAAWVPPVLLISFVGSSEAIRGNLSALSSLETAMGGAATALAIGGLAFVVGVVYLALVGFPALLVLWLLRLRHPVFSAVTAALVFLIPGRLRADDLGMFVFFAVVTGFIAGLYARRCGTDALKRVRERAHEL